MKNKLNLGHVCVACGKERKSRVMKYDPQTWNAYCGNPYICNEDHPNSPGNLIRRQKEVVLVDFAAANEAYKAELLDTLDPNLVDQVQRLMNYPFPLRLQDPAMAQFMIEFKEEHQFPSMAEVVRYALQMLMDNKNSYYNDHKEMKKELAQEAATQAVLDEVSGKKSEPEPEEEDNERLVF